MSLGEIAQPGYLHPGVERAESGSPVDPGPTLEFEDQPVEKLRADLEALLVAVIDCAEALAVQAPSRSLSMVKTKLDEAEMWLLRLDEHGKEGDGIR